MTETRIIKAVFGASKSIVAPKRFKNDWGQVLELVGITLPQTFTAHFANSKTGTAKKRVGQNNQVDVPDEFFTSGADIYCWVMVHDTVSDGRTMYTVRIPIEDRGTATDEEPTPVQQDVIEQAIAALNSAVEQTAQDVESADASAQSASDSADRAETARDTAEGYVSTVQRYTQQAQASASNASASATASAQSASTAQQIKIDVEGMVDEAQSAAGASAQSALESALSASQASTSASVAAQSAASAAESQQTTQQTAQDFEETAQQAVSDVNAAGTNQKELARRQAQNSEAWAVGQRDGDDVGVSDPTYHNNSKWYAQQAGTSEQSAGQSATGAASSAQAAAQSAAEAAESARTLTIDPTLTQSGQAADAKVVGDKITSLKEDLNDFSKLATGYNLIDPSTIVDGEFWNGVTTSSGNYSRTPLIAVKPNTAYTFANTEFNYWVTSQVRARLIEFFTADGTFISPRVENTGNFTTPENCAFVGISFYQNARKVILIEGTYDITTQTMVYIPYVADALKVNADSIDELSVDNISDYKVTGKNLFDKTKAVSGLLKQYPKVEASEITYTSDYIPVKANVSYIIWHDYIESTDFSLRSYVLYDVLHQKVTGESGDKKNFVITPTVDGYLRFSGYNVQIDRTQVEVGTVPTTYEPYKEVFPNKALLNDSQLAQVNNILYGKKWVVLGDSFSNSGGAGTKISDGKYKGRNYTYPWIIGNRNNMEIVRFFEGGRTLAFPANPSEFTNSITCPTSEAYYQNIPEDADYITIYLGINDEHHATGGGDGEDSTGNIPLGTITDSDTSTYYGAWNVVLTWLITNRPNAHIGIIVTNGLTIEAYRTAQIEIARKYGIPFIDMNGDDRTPAMLRTVNPNIATSVKQALVTKWAVDPSTNTHPNDAAHLFESAFIENFLRSI